MITRTRAVLVAAIASVCAAAAAPAASAQVGFEFEPGAQTFAQSGPEANLAGAHPDVTIGFGLRRDPAIGVQGRPPQAPRTSTAELPAGLIGDLRALDTCPMDDVVATEKAAGIGSCPRRAAAGTIRVDAYYPNGFRMPIADRRLWRVPATGNEVAAFGTSIVAVPVRFGVTVTPSGGYRVRAVGDQLPQSAMVAGYTATFWGVPADHQGPGPQCDGFIVAFSGQKICVDSNLPTDPDVHPDARFGGPLADAERVPFMTNPSVCGASLDASLRLVPYGTVFGPISTSMNAGTISGCELQPFHGGADVTPARRAAGQPSGYTVGIDVAQNADPDGVATAHVKDVEVTMPEGVAISPSSANGLAACSDAQFDIGGDAEPTCPTASRLGSVTVESPVLDDDLAGDVYVGSQRSQDPMSGQMYRLLVVVRGRGVLVKLAGGVKADPRTGRLTARFENNPQLPFNRIEMRLDDGQRASLVNPATCGSHVTNARLDAWSGKTAALSASTLIDQNCGPRGFAPSLVAGSENPVAGESSAFSMVVSRPDQTEELATLSSIELPTGLLGKVAGIPLCPAAAADAGTCGAESRVGHVQVAAGPGGSPLWVPQQGKAPTSVSLSGPYKGAPYSLSLVVPAQAGPYDLGRIVVRSPLHIDRVTAQLSTGIDVSRIYNPDGSLHQVIDGAMPTILKGIPLNVREVRVLIDRPDFTVNPTDCSEKQVRATVRGVSGRSAAVGSRFQVGDCAALRFKPRIGLRLKGRRQVKTGGHPALRALVRQRGGDEAAIRRAVVRLPKSLALDPENAQALCEFEDGTKPDLENHCPKGSIVGRARAVTPLLDRHLVGDVYFVKNVRIDPDTGNEIRTLPMLVVALRGDIAINLTGKSSTMRDGRLVNTFARVPDAPISRFHLNLKGGKNGILTVTRRKRSEINLCKAGRQVAIAKVAGQNGKRADQRIKVRTPCGKRKKAR